MGLGQGKVGCWWGEASPVDRAFRQLPREGWEEVFPTQRGECYQAFQAGGPALAEELGGGGRDQEVIQGGESREQGASAEAGGEKKTRGAGRNWTFCGCPGRG